MTYEYPQPPYQPPPPPPRKRYTWVWWTLGFIAALIVITNAASAAVYGSKTTTAGTTPIAPAAPAPTPPATPEGSMGPGVHVVGVDIQPGTYRTAGPNPDDSFPFCYWARLKSTDGDLNAIIANGNPEGRSTVTIKPTDKAFETVGCQPWVKT